MNLFFMVVGVLCAEPVNHTLDQVKPGKIIFITGSCSAGKSSIASIVAQRLNAKSFAFDELVMPVIMKKFIAKHYGKVVAALVTTMLGRNFFSSVSGLSEKTKYKYQKKFLADLKDGLGVEPTSAMYEKAKKAALAGHDVVVESPLFLFDGVTCFKSLEVFKDMDVMYVLAYCPWNNLIEHLRKRNRSENKKDHRELDWVIGNYVQYVQPSLRVQTDHHLEKIRGDHIQQQVAKYSQQKYKKKHMCLSNEIKNAVLAAFPTRYEYYIYPRFEYNLIVNTKMHDPMQGADIVLNAISN